MLLVFNYLERDMKGNKTHIFAMAEAWIKCKASNCFPGDHGAPFRDSTKSAVVSRDIIYRTMTNLLMN